MKVLNHKAKKHDIGLYDCDTGKSLNTLKAVDVSDDLLIPKGEEKLLLYYTRSKRGQIVQLRYGCARVFYIVEYIAAEVGRDSALSHYKAWTGATKERLAYLCLKYAPTRKAKRTKA